MEDNRRYTLLEGRYTLLVVGDNPEELISDFDGHKVEKYTLFDFSKKDEMYNSILNSYRLLSKDKNLNDEMEMMVKEKIQYLESIDSLEYYLDITEDYEIDDETGNVYSDENPDKKFDHCNIGKNFSMPFITNEGKETHQAYKKDINWNAIHLSNPLPYEIAWDTVMDGKKPENDDEKNIYENMKNRTAYFQAYGTRDNYVKSNTAFWTFAYLDKDGWRELGPHMDQFVWVNNFYDKFIKPLSDDSLLTIYECIRNI